MPPTKQKRTSEAQITFSQTETADVGFNPQFLSTGLKRRFAHLCTGVQQGA